MPAVAGAVRVTDWLLLAQAGVISPPMPDLGPIDLAEAIEWGAAHPASAATRTRAG